MNSADLFTIFMETGAPELYLMYKQSQRMEMDNVSKNTGSCITDSKL